MVAFRPRPIANRVVTAARRGDEVQHTAAELPTAGRRRNQGRETTGQFERREHQADAAARTGLGALSDQALGFELSQSLQSSEAVNHAKMVYGAISKRLPG